MLKCTCSPGCKHTTRKQNSHWSTRACMFRADSITVSCISTDTWFTRWVCGLHWGCRDCAKLQTLSDLRHFVLTSAAFGHCADDLMTKDIGLIAVHQMFPMWHGLSRLHTGSAFQPLAWCFAPFFAYQQTSYKDTVLVLQQRHACISWLCIAVIGIRKNRNAQY